MAASGGVNLDSNKNSAVDMCRLFPRIVAVHREESPSPKPETEDHPLSGGEELLDYPQNLKRRRLPLVVDDAMSILIAEADDPCSQFEAIVGPMASRNLPAPPMGLKPFVARVQQLRDAGELWLALNITEHQFTNFVAQNVPCVGCRRCVEKLFDEIAENRHEAMHPFQIDSEIDEDGDLVQCALGVSNSLLHDNKALHRHLVANHGKNRMILDALTSKTKKNAQSRRCQLHVIDSHACKDGNCVQWSDVWPLMSVEVREECCSVDEDALSQMLSTYEQKHRFCAECKNKLDKAYDCLVGHVDVSKQKGYNAQLYRGLKYCKQGAHLHVRPCVPYLDSLVERAQTELATGNNRERHAKTLEIGQIEVLTCLGVYLHGRLHRLSTALRTLHNTYHLLYTCAALAIFANLQEYVDNRNAYGGVQKESFERLCAELQMSTANPNAAAEKKDSQKSKRRKNKKSRCPSPPPFASNTTIVEWCADCVRKQCKLHTNTLTHKQVPHHKQRRSVSPPASHNHVPVNANVTNHDHLSKGMSALMLSVSPHKSDEDSDQTHNSPKSPLLSPTYPHRLIKRAARRFTHNKEKPIDRDTGVGLLAQLDDNNNLHSGTAPTSGTPRAATQSPPTSSPSDLGYSSSRETSPNNQSVHSSLRPTVRLHDIAEMDDTCGSASPVSPQPISARSIAWLRDNQKEIQAQRALLRQRVWQRFNALHERTANE